MLFVGDDWAEDHHDIEIVDDTGRVLARRRLPEAPGGITRLHALIGEHMPEGWADGEPARAAARVKVGIETARGPWVAALVATGYEVFAINPMSVARYRQRHSTSGAKSDSADAHVLAEIVRLDRAHHRPLAGDSDQGEAIKLTARTHQSLVWDRTRHVLRLRSALRDFFPVALQAFPDLDAPDALELLRRAADPDQAARLTRSRITAALRRVNRRNIEDKTTQLHAMLRAEQLRQQGGPVAWTPTSSKPPPRTRRPPGRWRVMPACATAGPVLGTGRRHAPRAGSTHCCLDDYRAGLRSGVGNAAAVCSGDADGRCRLIFGVVYDASACDAAGRQNWVPFRHVFDRVLHCWGLTSPVW
jgi:transposase